MRTVLPITITLLLALSPAAQTPPATPATAGARTAESPFDRGDDVFALLQRDGKFVDVQWRRTAAGDWEWALAGIAKPEFKRLYGDSLRDVLTTSGLAVLLPYELVRRLGNARFDHTCVALAWTDTVDGPFDWAGVAAGVCEPDRVANGLRDGPLEDFAASADGESTRARWRGGSGTAQPRRVTAHTDGVEVAAHAPLAAHVLRDGEYGVRIHLPPESKVLAALAPFRFPGTITPDVPVAYDLDVVFGDAIVLDETFTMVDEDAAERVGSAAFPLLERLAAAFQELAPDSAKNLLGETSPPKISVVKTVVRVTRAIPRSRFPDMAALRAWAVERARYR